MPEVRIDAVAQGDALSLDLAEELQQLAPFGQGNPPVSLLVPAAHLTDPHALGENGRHVALHAQRRRRPLALRALRQRRRRSRSSPTSPPTPPCGWRSTASTAPSRRGSSCAARSRAGRARSTSSASRDVRGRPCCRELDRDLARPPTGAGATDPARARGRTTRDLRGTGIAGLLADLVATGEPVLAVVAHAPHRARALAARVGGFALTAGRR